MIRTPSSSLPYSDSKLRFHDMSFGLEWIEKYRPGGYHPIIIGDSLKRGQYKIIRKLNFGSYSTVWAAKDCTTNQFVGLKVLKANASNNTRELSILRHVSQSSHHSEHFVTLLDEFWEKGPNGLHLCLALELTGPNLADGISLFTQPVKHDERFPYWVAKQISYEVLKGLKALHGFEICHGDLQYGNILFDISNTPTISEFTLQQDLSQPIVSEAVQRLDGKVDRWAPSHLTYSQPMRKWLQIRQVEDIKVRLTDFGQLFYFCDPPLKISTPISFRAPELVAGKKFDWKIDIWSLGALIYELITNLRLFPVCEVGLTTEEINDDHYFWMNARLGKLPDEYISHWGNYNENFDENDNIINKDIEDIPRIREKLLANKPDGMSEDEAHVLLSLLKQTLQYDPKHRPSAAALLEHPWFA